MISEVPTEPDALAPAWEAGISLAVSSHTVPAAFRVSEDTFVVAARFADNAVRVASFRQQLPGLELVSDWAMLSSGLFTDDPIVIPLGAGAAQLFIRGHDELLYSAHFEHGQWAYWWHSGVSLKQTPASAANSRGEVLTAGLALDRRVISLSSLVREINENWTKPWQKHELEADARPAVVGVGSERFLVAVTCSDGRLAFAVSSPGKQLEFTALDGPELVSAPTLVSRAPATVDLFGRGRDGLLYWRSWVDGVWQDWWRVSHPDMQFVSNPAAVATSDGLFVFAKDGDGVGWARRLSAKGWTAWAPVMSGLSAAVGEDFPGSALAIGDDEVALLARDKYARLFWWEVRQQEEER